MKRSSGDPPKMTRVSPSIAAGPGAPSHDRSRGFLEDPGRSHGLAGKGAGKKMLAGPPKWVQGGYKGWRSAG